MKSLISLQYLHHITHIDDLFKWPSQMLDSFLNTLLQYCFTFGLGFEDL